MKNIFYAAIAASLMCLLTGGIITLATAAPTEDVQPAALGTAPNIEAELAAHLDAVIATQLQSIQQRSGIKLR